MRVDDGAEFGPHGEAGEQIGGDRRRHRHDYRIVARKIDRVFAEVEFARPCTIERERAQPMTEADRTTVLRDEVERRIDEGASEPMGGDERVARLSAGGYGLA